MDTFSGTTPQLVTAEHTSTSTEIDSRILRQQDHQTQRAEGF